MLPWYDTGMGHHRQKLTLISLMNFTQPKQALFFVGQKMLPLRQHGPFI